MNKHDKRRHAAAYHEAGHAALHLYFEHEVERVSIEPNEDSDGQVSLGRSEFRDDDFVYENGLEITQVPLERRIIAALAGVIAQRRYAPGCWDEHRDGHADRQVAYAYMDHLDIPNEAVFELQFKLFELRAEALVERLWPRIERIAQRLLQVDALTGEEALDAYRDPRFAAVAQWNPEEAT